MTAITSPTPDQLAAMPRYVEKWRGIGRCTGPAARPAINLSPSEGAGTPDRRRHPRRPRPQRKGQMQVVIDAHAKAGRVVRVWNGDVEGEDLNDVVRRLRAEEREKGAA
jgi:hypothetical protein